MRTAVIIGAGIGGLAAARALALRGWRVRVLERARALESVGAGLAVAPNALRALDTLGLGDAVRARGAIGSAGIRTWRGRRLLPTDADAMRERFGDTIVVLPRTELVDLLGGGPVAGLVHTSAEAVLTDPGDRDRPARVTADGREWTADLVVAADGVRSRTRGKLVPDHPGPVYSGTTTWRLIARGVTVEEAGESWGPEGLVGMMPLAAGGTYFYAMARMPAAAASATRLPPATPGATRGEGSSAQPSPTTTLDGRPSAATPPMDREPPAPADEHAALVRRFGHWHDPVPAVLAGTAPDAVLRNDVWHSPVPPHAYHHGRVALLGDAAHAMTPNLGQGACMALEDAVTLAHAAGDGSADTDLPEALAAYTAARLPRASGIVRRSAAVGRMSTLRHPVARAVRDTGIRLVGRVAPSLFYGPVEATFGWRPPTG